MKLFVFGTSFQNQEAVSADLLVAMASSEVEIPASFQVTVTSDDILSFETLLNNSINMNIFKLNEDFLKTLNIYCSNEKKVFIEF